jgi:hypothetical protein
MRSIRTKEQTKTKQNEYQRFKGDHFKARARK